MEAESVEKSSPDCLPQRSVYTSLKRNIGWRSLFCCIVLIVYTVMMLQSPGVVKTTSMKKAGKKTNQKGHPRFIAKSQEEGELLAEFGRRKKNIKDVCDQLGAYTSKEKFLAKLKLEPEKVLASGVETDLQIWNLLKQSSHHQFFLEKKNDLLWCKVPKAASTSWLYAFLYLAQVPEYQIPQDNGMGLHGLLREKYPLLAKNLYRKHMPSALKFMVVRHPFERLMSAFTDKLDSYNRDLKYRGGYYFAMYGSDIVERYREMYLKKFPKNPLFLRKEPSFVEFVHYLIETPVASFDEHWKPIFLLCPPCHFSFDIIIKMETFNRDSEYILKYKDLDISLKKKHSSSSQHQKSFKERKSPEDLKKYLFSQLSKSMVRALYDKYRVDFQMFGYDIQEFISYARDSNGLMPDDLSGF